MFTNPVTMRKNIVLKPWGKSEVFCLNEKVSVKIHTVKKGESLSLQYHQKRDELWRILSGRARVIISKESKIATPGDEFKIKHNSVHRLTALSSEVVFLEIAWGDFSEADIVRLEDKYNRIK